MPARRAPSEPHMSQVTPPRTPTRALCEAVIPLPPQPEPGTAHMDPPLVPVTLATRRPESALEHVLIIGPDSR